MTHKRDDGYIVNDTAINAYEEGEKMRKGKFNSLGLLFGVIFGLPFAFLILALAWKIIKWVLSIE